MRIPPIIERELRVALRRKRVLKNRFIFACGAVWLTAALLFMPGFANPQKTGQEVFLFLFRIGCLVSVVETVRLTADLFSSERRNNTLGLLFLSGLSAVEVFASKLCGGAFMAFCSVLSLLPCFAVTFLTGGLSAATFIAAACYLPSLLLFTLAMSVLGSTLSEDESEAMVAAALIGTAVCLVAPTIYFTLGLASATGAVARTWLLFSPAYGFVLVSESFTTAKLADLLANAAAMVGWGALALATAAKLMSGRWRDQPYLVSEHGWRAWVRLWVRGPQEWRTRLRRCWLDSNPYLWLAMQNRRPVMSAWMMVAIVTFLWGFNLLTWPQHVLSVPSFLLLTVVLEGIIIWTAVYAAAKRFGDDRRSGAFELLLTTPLTAAQIVRAQHQAVVLQFKPLMEFLLATILTLFVTGFCIRHWDWPAVVVYLIVWSSLVLWTKLIVETGVWDAMWISVNSGRPGYATMKSLWAPPMIVPLIMVGFNAPKSSGLGEIMGHFPRGTVGEIVLVIALLVIPVLFLAFSQQNRKREMQLGEELSAIVQEPVAEPSDLRFAKRDVRYRFPTPKR